MAKREITKRVDEMLDTLDLTAKASRKARALTADEKQKISLGRGLVRYDVNAILFDEPLTVIDPHMKWQLRTKLKELHEQFAHTMIYVTHDQTEAMTFADKVVVMYDGEVVQIGTPEELFDEPAHTFVGYFIGSPGMNILPGSVQGSTATIGGTELPLHADYGADSDGIEFGIRPEFVRLVDAGSAGPSGMPITVASVEDIGRYRIVRGTANGHEIGAVVDEMDSIPENAGGRVRSGTHQRVQAFPSDQRESARMKPFDNRAWFFVLPVFLLVAISAIIPLMTVVNYSVQDTFGNNQFFWAGTEWYTDVLTSDRFTSALLRNLAFSGIILAIEIPLGIAIALAMPRKGVWVSVCLVLMALPLLIPWNVVGTIWQVFGRDDIGLLGRTLSVLGINFNYGNNWIQAWIIIVVMDVWHWTSLVVLLCYSGLVAIPEAYYQAARIDGASSWKVFRYIQLPKMQRVLLIAVLLRFMDSFMIYTEPFVLTGGGPGSTTTFMSIDLVKMAIGQFDLGPAAAMSIVYFLIILLLSWVFYTVMTNVGADAAERPEQAS